MVRSLAITTLVLSSFLATEVAFGQSAPPVCPQGSWAQRTSGGWSCSKNMTPPDDTPTKSTTGSGSRGHGSRGGMNQ
jgi:hypothetical protein